MCEIYFKVNNKITRTTSLTLFWCFYYLLYAHFTYFSSVSIIDFEQLNVSWVVGSVHMENTETSDDRTIESFLKLKYQILTIPYYYGKLITQ